MKFVFDNGEVETISDIAQGKSYCVEGACDVCVMESILHGDNTHCQQVAKKIMEDINEYNEVDLASGDTLYGCKKWRIKNEL